MMKKSTTLILAACILFSSCASTTSQSGYLGTMAGAEIGGTIGEAIGWMSTSRHEGPGKAMLGSIIGTVAGAVIGHEMATQAERKAEKRHENKKREYEKNREHEKRQHPRERDTYGYQTKGGYGSENMSSQLTISNLSYQDEDGNGRFSRYETINIIFEVRNNGMADASVTLSVDDPLHIKEIAFSPSNVVTIHPGQTIRYKAKAFCKSNIRESHSHIICTASSTTAGTAKETLRIKMDE